MPGRRGVSHSSGSHVTYAVVLSELPWRMALFLLEPGRGPEPFLCFLSEPVFTQQTAGVLYS